MATKKQKRAAALARREAFMAEHRQAGLDALHRSQETMANQRAATDAKIAELNKEGRRVLAIALAIEARPGR